MIEFVVAAPGAPRPRSSVAVAILRTDDWEYRPGTFVTWRETRSAAGSPVPLRSLTPG